MSKHRAKASKQGREEVARGRWGRGGGGVRSLVVWQGAGTLFVMDDGWQASILMELLLLGK